MSPDIIPLRDIDPVAYDKFLLQSDAATFYHSEKYQSFLQALLGCGDVGLAAVREGRLVGVLPLLALDGPFGTVINSSPFFGSLGGIVSEDRPARQALWHAYREVARADGVAAATIVGNPFDEQGLDAARDDLDVEDERICQVTVLESGSGFEAQLLERIDGSARRNIKNAKRVGITVSVENDALPFLEQSHRAGMDAIGGRKKPEIFFRLVPSCFEPDRDFRVYVARLNSKPVAALLVFYYKRFAEYFVPTTEPSARASQPMAAILARAMVDAAEMGCRVWNWGGTWLSQTGVYRFKRKWGAVERPYRYRTMVCNRAILQEESAMLSRAYGFFYVVPFSALAGVDAPTRSVQ